MISFRKNSGSDSTVKVNRTAEGTAFEIATAVLNVIMWGIIAWQWNRLPEQIVTKVDLMGNPTEYGERSDIIIMGAIGTVVSAIMCVSAYFPTSTINLPVKLNTPLRIALGVRLIRICAIFISLLFISIVTNAGGVSGDLSGFSFIVSLAIAVAMIVVIAIYSVKIHRS